MKNLTPAQVQSTINNALDTLFKGTSFENYQYHDFDSADELIDNIREEISGEEVIYYSNAMKYLSENDNSLMESMSLAHELGYTAENINSELLATLLQQQKLNEELSDLVNEIEAIYSESDV